MPVLEVVEDLVESNEAGVSGGASLLDKIVRDGARKMLAAALQAEVAEYLARFVGEVDESGYRLPVRNGNHAELWMNCSTCTAPLCARSPGSDR